jgi:hypothetical protein
MATLSSRARDRSGRFRARLSATSSGMSSVIRIASLFGYYTRTFNPKLSGLRLARQIIRIVSEDAPPDDTSRKSQAGVSYRYICKRLERLGLVRPGQFNGVQFQKLEDEIYGAPFYRRRR